MDLGNKIIDQYRDKILELNEIHKIHGEIYIIKCKDSSNLKVYVGQTRSHRKNKGKYRPYGSAGRFASHLCEAIRNTKKSGCTYLNNAIRKYGVDNFYFEVLEKCTLDELDLYEKYYIKEYNSVFPNGYNLTTGGSGNTTWFNKKKEITNDQSINIPIKRGREFGYKHKEETKTKIGRRLRENEESFGKRKKTMKDTMNNYYDEIKIKKLSEIELDYDFKKYIRPVYKKNTGELYNYIIRINRDRKFTMRSPNDSLQETYNRLYNALEAAYKLRQKEKSKRGKNVRKMGNPQPIPI